MTAPSSERLAKELEKAGLPALARKAREDHYHDFLSKVDFPAMELDHDLRAISSRSSAARSLLERHHAGEFDASNEESEEWARGPEGQNAFQMLVKGK